MNNDKKSTDSTRTTSVSTVTIPSSDIVTTITPPHGLPQKTVYDASTPTNQIIEDSTAAANIELEPYYREEIMETVEGIHEAGNTIVLVTHEQYIAEHAHRTIHLLDGLISQET